MLSVFRVQGAVRASTSKPESQPSQSCWKEHQVLFSSDKVDVAQALFQTLCTKTTPEKPNNTIAQLEFFFRLRELADSAKQGVFQYKIDAAEPSSKKIHFYIAGDRVASGDASLHDLSLSETMIKELDNGKNTVEQQALDAV